MIGFYNCSVILTYFGLASSVVGMAMAMRGAYKIAFLCLMLSGVCDLFDGRVASRVKRSEHEKMFGIQIDSLCDLVCFGVFPVILLYNFFRDTFRWYWIAVAVVYILGAIIRLGYFNVFEEERQRGSSGKRTHYQGLPVTSVALFLPMVYALDRPLGKGFDYQLFYGILMLVIAVLFVLNVKVKKPGTAETVIMCGVGLLVLVGVILGS